MCENQSCEISVCTLRHPKICRYFRDFGRCKFSEWCHFRHVENIQSFDNSEISTLKMRISDIEKIIQEKDEAIKHLSNQFETLKQELTKPQDQLDLDQLEMILTEHEKKHKDLEIKIDTLEKIVGDVSKRLKHNNCETNEDESEIDRTHEEETDTNLLETTFHNPTLGFNCAQCDFVAKTERSLKTHMSRKHVKI